MLLVFRRRIDDGAIYIFQAQVERAKYMLVGVFGDRFSDELTVVLSAWE